MNPRFRRVLLVFLCLGLVGAAHAEDTNPPHGGPPASTPASARMRGRQAADTRTSALLNAALGKLGATLEASPLEASRPRRHYAVVSTQAEALRDTARAYFNQMDAENRFINGFNPSMMVQLPVAFRQEVGQNSFVEIGLVKAKVYPLYAEVTAFIRIKLQLERQNAGGEPATRELLFGVDKLKIGRDGGVIGDAKLALLGDVEIPLGKATLLLKGGLDLATGDVAEKTYCTLDCNGFREVGVAASIIFPEDVLMPLDGAGQPIKNGLPVQGDFSIIVRNVNDILATVSLPPFAVKGFDKVGFVLDGAVFDFSDYRNHGGQPFPSGYLARHYPDSVQGANLWRGVYARTFRMYLPEEFRLKNTPKGQRIIVDAQNLMVDAHGFTSDLRVENVYPLSQGSASGWAMSLDAFALRFEESKLVAGSFLGKLLTPLTKPQEDQALLYKGMITPMGYNLTVGNTSALDFSFWKAKATLAPNSRLELAVVEGNFKPRAILSGTMGIVTGLKNTSSDSSKNALQFKGVEFQELTLQTEKPYISAKYFGYRGESKLANFPVTVDELGVRFLQDSIAALRIGVRLNLMGKGFSARTAVEIYGAQREVEGNQQWQFQRVRLQSIMIDGSVSAFGIKGELNLHDDDPVYGNGFDGRVELKITTGKDSLIKVVAGAGFGRALAGYRYWFVDGGATFSPGIPVGPLQINQIAGAAYHNMKPAAPAGATQLASVIQYGSGVRYVPDTSVSLAFKAIIGFKGVKVLDGMAGFEMAFHQSKGLKRVALFGMATVNTNFASSLVSDAKGLYASMENKVSSVSNGALGKLQTKISQNNLVKRAQNEFPIDPSKVSGSLIVQIGLEMDFERSTFHGQADAFVKVTPPVIRGVGPNGRAGWAVIHIDPQEWYIHMGSPTDRLGLEMNLGVATAKATGYFMVGHRIPGMPPPPARLASLIGSSVLSQRQAQRDTSLTNTGQGMAFGVDVSAKADFTAAIFYVSIEAGAGFDLMLKKCNTGCSDASYGMNGWYAGGQAYAYLDADVGLQVYLPFKRRRFSVLNGGVGALLEAEGPNPTHLKGTLAGRYSILGGSVRGNFNIKVEFGQTNTCGLQCLGKL